VIQNLLFRDRGEERTTLTILPVVTAAQAAALCHFLPQPQPDTIAATPRGAAPWRSAHTTTIQRT
jgi:hypothetical protein